VTGNAILRTALCLMFFVTSREAKEIAHSQQATLSKLVSQIDQTRQQGNLSSAIRLYVLEQIRDQFLVRSGSQLFGRQVEGAIYLVNFPQMG
jgi:predicted DNA-binding ribbon-helix-helix protein